MPEVAVWTGHPSRLRNVARDETEQRLTAETRESTEGSTDASESAPFINVPSWEGRRETGEMSSNWEFKVKISDLFSKRTKFI